MPPADPADPPALDDWSRVDPGTFHGFHRFLVVQIGSNLNTSLLPAGYYAQVEPTLRPLRPHIYLADGSDRKTDLSAACEAEGYASEASRLTVRR